MHIKQGNTYICNIYGCIQQFTNIGKRDKVYNDFKFSFEDIVEKADFITAEVRRSSELS